MSARRETSLNSGQMVDSVASQRVRAQAIRYHRTAERDKSDPERWGPLADGLEQHRVSPNGKAQRETQFLFDTGEIPGLAGEEP
jgi:hypothetical protein